MKKTICLVIACLFLTVVAQAQEPDKGVISIWEKIRKKIEKITPKQKPTVTTAVGGVRGAQSEQQELYWKGEEGPLTISPEEIDLFSSALQLAEGGDPDQASNAFNDFLAKFPDSALAADAQIALAELASHKKADRPATTQAPPAAPHDFTPPDLPDFKVGM